MAQATILTNGAAFGVLHHFSPIDPITGSNVDGASPCSALIVFGKAIYGTASAGGVGGVRTKGISVTCPTVRDLTRCTSRRHDER